MDERNADNHLDLHERSSVSHGSGVPGLTFEGDTVDGRYILYDWLLSNIRKTGTIKFKGSKNMYRDPRARYVVIDKKIDIKQLLKVFTNGWKLGTPKLVVNICGGDEQCDVSNRLKEILRHSLLHAARNIDAWVLTNGLNTGVMKFLGRSMRDFAVSSANRRGKQAFPIGIVDLSNVQHSSLFLKTPESNSKHDFDYDLSYRDKSNENGQGENDKLHLNPNHPFFILIESNSEQSRDICTELRCAIMDEISNLKLCGTTTTVPVVTLVIAGGSQSIHIAHRIIMNQSPLVILAGSGGAADILAFAYQYAQSRDKVRKEDEIKLTSGLNSRLQSSFGSSERVELLAKCKEMVQRKSNVSIYHLHGTSVPSGTLSTKQLVFEDIVEAIIASLPKGEKGNQLHLAVIWNLLELVNQYLRESRSWKDDDLIRSFEFALHNDLTDVIKQFLQYGVNLHEFLNVSKLVSLYAKIADDCLLKEMLQLQERKLGSKLMTLRVVSRVIRKLSLQGYHTLCESHEEYTVENPMRELFIWAVLQMRVKTAKLFWFEDKAPLGGALLACKMMKAMSELEQDPQQVDQMDTLASEYETWAVQILHDYYKEDRRKTSLSIIRELEDWGRVSCLCLASSGRMKSIIAHPAVQNLLDELWSGKIKINSEIKHFISLMCPFISMFLLRYRPPIDAHGVAVEHIRGHKLTKSGGNKQAPVDKHEPQSQSPERTNSSMTKSRWNFKCMGFSSSSRLPETSSYSKNDQYSLIEKFLFFISAPFIVFRYDVISYVIFCVLYTYMMLFDFGENPSVLEYVLIFWVGTLVIDEIRQIQENPSPKLSERIMKWLTGYWNIVDIVSMVLFCLGISLRHYPPTLDAARVLLALDLVAFFLRSLHIFSTNRHLGPKLIMIIHMFVDLIIFICILAVFLVAYGISVEIILYPNTSRPFTVLLGIIERAYFQIYGELFLDDINEGVICSTNITEHELGAMPCPENSWFASLALAFYLFLSNILLLNLLIAMLNFTFQAIQDNCDILWKFQRLGLLQEYYTRPPLPPPFIIIFHVLYFVCYVWRAAFGEHCFLCTLCQNAKSFKRKLDDHLNEEIATWESVKGQDFVIKARQKLPADSTNFNKLTTERLDAINQELQRIKNETMKFDDRFSKLEDQLKPLLEQLKTEANKSQWKPR